MHMHVHERYLKRPWYQDPMDQTLWFKIPQLLKIRQSLFESVAVKEDHLALVAKDLRY